jgi:hypothetical protein
MWCREINKVFGKYVGLESKIRFDDNTGRKIRRSPSLLSNFSSYNLTNRGKMIWNITKRSK